MTDILLVNPTQPERALIERAAALVRRGGLVAFPTETVYGLGAHALDSTAVRRIFVAKGRPSTDPLIVHVGSTAEALALVAGSVDMLTSLASVFWPGPLTLVLPRAAAIPDDVTAGGSTVALRIPAHPVARALLAAAGVPIAAPSANLFSRPSPTLASHVMHDLEGRIDLVLDGGPTTVGVESTVLDLSCDPPVILRAGAVTEAMLRPFLPNVTSRDTDVVRNAATVMPSPGLLDKHYSPRTPLTLFEGPSAIAALRARLDTAMARQCTVGVLLTREDAAVLMPADHARLTTHVLGSRADLAAVAAGLYAALRTLDAANLDEILVCAFPFDQGLGRAIHDRLTRAAAGNIVRTTQIADPPQ